jgi:hypothetical protein
MNEKVVIGSLVRLKPSHVIKTQQGTLDPDEHYNPDDWVGIVTSFPGFEQDKKMHMQMELFITCCVMWRGRPPVGEFIDHLEVLQ